MGWMRHDGWRLRFAVLFFFFPLNKAPGHDVGIPQRFGPPPPRHLGPYLPRNGAGEAAPGVAVREEEQEEARPCMADGRYHGDQVPPRSPRYGTAHAQRPECTSAPRACASPVSLPAYAQTRISPFGHAHLPAASLRACALPRAATPAHHGRRRPLLRRLRHFFLPTWRAAMGSLSSRLLRQRGGPSLVDGAAGEGGRGGGGRRGGKRKRGGGEGPGDSESESDSERDERLHSAPRRSGAEGGAVMGVLGGSGVGGWGLGPK